VSPEGAVAEVRAAHARATKAAGSSGLFTSAAQDASIAELRKLGPVIETWATQHLAMARKGTNLAGLPFTLPDWAKVGREHIRSCAHYVDCTAAGSQLDALAAASVATVKDTAELVEKTAKVGLNLAPYAVGLGLLVVGGLSGLPLVRGARAVAAA
jgi:hypothetical protein